MFTVNHLKKCSVSVHPYSYPPIKIQFYAMSQYDDVLIWHLGLLRLWKKAVLRTIFYWCSFNSCFFPVWPPLESRLYHDLLNSCFVQDVFVFIMPRLLVSSSLRITSPISKIRFTKSFFFFNQSWISLCLVICFDLCLQWWLYFLYVKDRSP